VAAGIRLVEAVLPVRQSLDARLPLPKVPLAAWPFFVSASTNSAIASQFGKTLFVVEVPASGNVVEIAHCSLYPDEGGVLFFPYEVFEVLESGPTEVRVRISDDIFLGVPGRQVKELGGGAKEIVVEPSPKKRRRRDRRGK
jgi:NAD:arginine ADP-ribosyltransferase